MQHKPLKRFGQNFLTQPAIAEKIVAALKITKTDSVIEIGPGTGVLTEIIVSQTPAEYFAIEIDRNLAEQLRGKYANQVDIIETDFLEWDFSEKSANNVLKIIGNIPYYITSQILFKMIDHFSQIDSAVIMLQKEVAERVVANPGNKNYGILSIMMQTFAEVKYLFTVEAPNFWPVPNVDSAAIKFNFLKEVEGIDNMNIFKKIVRSVFNYRRKMLRNTLSRIFDKTIVTSLSKFDLTRRPEQLAISEFKEMANKVNSLL